MALNQPFVAGSINDNATTKIPLHSKHSLHANKSAKVSTHANIDDLKNDKGYGVYHALFTKIRFLIIFLGLWAPTGPGCARWCLRHLYPVLIYAIILYPWSTFITQQAYWSIPVFLFISLHISGWVCYYASRAYWKQNHLHHFITSTFVPYHHSIDDFQRNYRIADTFGKHYHSVDVDNDHKANESNQSHSLRSRFLARYERDNQKRKAAAQRKFHLNTLLSEADQKQTTFSDIEQSTNKLSMTLFYEGVERLWWRFWMLSALITLPVIAVLCTELFVPSLHSSIDTSHGGIHHGDRSVFVDVFVPLNTLLIFVRITYVMCEFVFMLFYFKFLCECHRGDVLIHLHYFDLTPILERFSRSEQLQSAQFFAAIQARLAEIVWNWDRVVSLSQATSVALRYWILITFVCNFIAAVVAIINLSTHLEQFPQHLEMYIPAVLNVIFSFYVLFVGAQIAHMNTMVEKRVYFLLATTHFAHVQQGGHGVREENDEEKDVESERVRLQKQALVELRQQNVYQQAQVVANTASSMQIGIAVYGMVLHRNLFLAFFAPFIAFFAFCLNEWLPKGI